MNFTPKLSVLVNKESERIPTFDYSLFLSLGVKSLYITQLFFPFFYGADYVLSKFNFR